MELSGYLAVARRWWWTLLVATWVAAVSGYVVASQIPPTYESRVQLLVGPYNTDSDTLRAAGQLVQTYAELVTTQPLLESAIAEVSADIDVGNLDAGDLDSATRVTADETTRFLAIRVQDTVPERAAALANGLAEEISLLASRGTSRPEGQLQIVDRATPPTVPIAPQVSLIVGMAGLAALIGALVLVMLVEYLSATVRTQDDLQKLTGVPFLGKVDTAKALPSGHRALVDSVPDSAAAAAYRLVVAKASVREGQEPASSIAAIGTGVDTATAQVAANLAAIAARGGRRVVLIDTDSADAHASRIFGLVGRVGLSDLAADPSLRPIDVIATVSGGLKVIPVGTAGDAETLDVDRARAILDALTEAADLVVVSTGPLHLAAATLVWARVADAAICVAVRDQSRRDDVTYAIESLRMVGVAVRGTVLAERRRSIGRATTPDTDDAEGPALRVASEPEVPEAAFTRPRAQSASGRTRAPRRRIDRPGS